MPVPYRPHFLTNVIFITLPRLCILLFKPNKLNFNSIQAY